MSTLDWVEEKAVRAIDPERCRAALASIADVWPEGNPPLPELLRKFPSGEDSILHLLSVSPVSTEKLVKDPGALFWLADPVVCMANRGPRRMRSALLLAGSGGPFDPTFGNLRRCKGREMLRLALREVAGLSSVEETTLELSYLAEVCIGEVTDGWLKELSRRWGHPASEFAVLGMGKFGGQELNYSSDIDVIFLYGEEGWLNANFSYHEFFTRLAEKISVTFSAVDPTGALFRIDLRLRPEGASGPLVRSLESMEHYYAGYGETWERIALIKARGVAGSAELAYDFSRRLQPFIFPRTLSADVLEEVSSIKTRIEREIVGAASLHRDVKLGYGGIREIEFVAQTFQLIHGARNAFLQERNTLKALRGLEQLELLPAHDADILADAYRFLRTVEHRLQIEREAQTHTIPDKPEAVARLSRSLGFPAPVAFYAELVRHTEAVRAIFDRTLRAAPEFSAAQPRRELGCFADRAAAETMLADLAGGGGLGHISPRTRRLSAKLEPFLLDALRRVADPDITLARLIRFVERYGIRGTLFEALVVHPRLLELLVRLFDSSRFMTDIVLRRPALIDEVAREGLRPFAMGDHLTGLAGNDERLEWGDWVRAYRRSQLLRIFLRDVLSFATLEEVHAEYTALAEACTRFVLQQLGLEDRLAVVALGRFGGRELSYGCDLDVVFVGTAPADAARFIKSMTAVTAEGLVFPVDARLRPEGNSGVLAIPLAAWEEYFQGRAQFWEGQALTRARPVAGSVEMCAGFAEFSERAWRRFGAFSDAMAQVKAMHARVVHERSSGNDLLDFKTGRGGLMEAEFCLQGLQLQHGVWEQNSLAAIAALARQGILSLDQAGELRDSWLFLRRVEAVLRRVDNSSVSTLPREEAEQSRLAIRTGFENRETFLAHFSTAREKIHAIAGALW